MSQNLLIQGGRKICGEHIVSGNKNAALPMIAAALLADTPVVLENVPDISDVACMLEAARRLGAKIERDYSKGTVSISASRIRSVKLDQELANKIRTSFLFVGPLLARAKRVVIPPPGGDQIGRRRLDSHIAGFKMLGAKTTAKRNAFSFRGELKGARILLDEASVTATENILMAAVLAKGKTEIYNAACEPHIVNLASMLIKMGAKISGAGTNKIVVEGVSKLSGCRARVWCDYIEAGSFVVAAAVTKGDILLRGIDPEPFEVLEGVFKRFGVEWEIDPIERTLRYTYRKRLKMSYDFGDVIPSVSDGPWPSFPSDLLSIVIVLASQTRGTCLFFEKMFESRLYFIDSLRQMGAKIVQCDPHRVVVTGPSRLYGGTISSPDIRAGIALVIAALAAKGQSVIRNAEIIDRGYVAIETSLSKLGASITRDN